MKDTACSILAYVAFIKFAAISGILALLTGCTPKTIKVVDAQGNPVAGALVISEQEPYILQPWKLGVYITDKNGEAKVVSARGHIFKPGYFPVINASELHDEILWQPQSYFSSTTPIYPIDREDVIPVNTSVYITEHPVSKDVYAVPIKVCPTVRVTYHIADTQLTAKSDTPELRLSPRFHFAGAADNMKTSELTAENNLAFYCKHNEELYKVGVSVASQVWNKDIPAHRLTLFTAKVSSEKAYLQPEVKCFTGQHMVSGQYRTGKPRVFHSPNIRNEMIFFRDTIPCANQSFRNLLQYIESVTE